jgi:hypothetical protein
MDSQDVVRRRRMVSGSNKRPPGTSAGNRSAVVVLPQPKAGRGPRNARPGR